MVGGGGQGNTYRILKNGDTLCDSATVGKQPPAIIWKVGNISKVLAEMPQLTTEESKNKRCVLL